MWSSKLAWALAGSALGFAVVARRIRQDPARAALENEDARFHRAYDAARSDAAEQTPALVFMEGKFIFSADGERREYAASAPASQLLKAAAHAPLGVFALLWPLPYDAGAAALSPPTKAQLLRSLDLVQRAQASLRDEARNDGLSDHARADSIEVLRITHEFLNRISGQDHVERASLSSFARTLGPRLLQLTEHATELELSALHTATEAALRDMTPKQRDRFEVIVAGAHQARDRNLPVQYFQQRFDEAPGEERRVAFAESVSDADEARALVGTRRLDRAIAEAFFGKSQRLQRDVLGDAAEHLLKRQVFAPITEADSQATQQRSRLTHAAGGDVSS